mmetsp:Transcript_1636/g.3505  ORF Transcript_1636/g.3505 Transcript_1636/m.3505 type:complete len:137 (+) Transcript_1636:350-760(+)
MKTITTHSNNNITRFLEMNWEENRNFCKEIGVQALPMVKMFTKDGEVESFPCGPKKVELLRAKLDEWKSTLLPFDTDAGATAALEADAASSTAGATGATGAKAEKGAVAETGAISTSTSTASAADANSKAISRPVG